MIEPDVLDSREAGGRIIRGGVVRGVGYVANTLMALLGVALVTRHLGVADFGRFQTILSIITVVGAITDAGMATLGIREYAQRSGAERERLITTLLGLRVALTLVGVGAATAIAVSIGYEPELVLGTFLAGLGLVLTVIQTTFTIPLAANLENVRLTAVEMARQALTVLGYVLAVVAGAGVTVLLGIQIPVGIAMVALAAYLVRGRIPLRPHVRFDEWAGLLRASVVFAMATAVGTIYLYTAQILTAAVTDAHETGLFATSFRVFVVIAIVPGLLITVAFPLLSRAARDDRERLRYAVQRLLDTTFPLGLAAAIGMVVGAPVIIAVMAGPDFAAAEPALRIQGATLVATFTMAPIGFALLALHAHRAILVVNVIALVVMVSAVAGLAAAYGAEGAALGTVIGETVLATGYLVTLDPTVRPSLARPSRALLAAAPCLLLALVEIPSVVAVTIALAVYGALLLALGVVPAELLEAARLRRR